MNIFDVCYGWIAHIVHRHKQQIGGITLKTYGYENNG